jgi:hypothetical protein
MTPETATAETPDFDATAMPEEKEGTVLEFLGTKQEHGNYLPENDSSKFNSPVFPTTELDPDIEEFRRKMGQLNMRLTTSRKVDNVFRR